MTPSRQPPKGRPPSPVDESTPGGRLRALRTQRGWNQDALAEKLGIERANVSRYETNQIVMPDHIITRAAVAFGVSPAFIRYGDVENRMVQVSGRVGAGGEVEAIEAPPFRHVEIPASWSDAVALEISGLSGWPIYDDRDVIVIRGEQRLEESEFLGKMCVVETADGRGMLKRVRRGSQSGRYNLESINAPPVEDVTLFSARPVRLHISE